MSHLEPYDIEARSLTGKPIKHPYFSLQTSLKPLSDSPRKYSTNANSPSYWKPLSLTLPFLFDFGCALLCIFVALLTIRHYADEQHGFSLITSNHYTWTYAPTAIFTILISLWRHVDYHCKALLPWSELAKGPVDADRSILLDYVSPLLPVTITKAIRQSQFVIVLTVLGFMLLKLAMLASTGLFFPSIVTVGPLNTKMIQTARFDNLTEFSSSHNIPGPSPFYTAYAVIDRDYDLPEGIGQNLVYEKFRPVVEHGSPNTIYRGNTTAMFPQVRCDIVQADVLFDMTQYTRVDVLQSWPIQLHNDSLWTCSNSIDFTVDSCAVAAEICPPRQIIPTFGTQYHCNCTAGTKQDDAYPLLISLSDLRYSQTFNISLENYTYGQVLEPEQWNFEVPANTAMLCQISYRIGSFQVTYNMSMANPAIAVEEVPLSTPIKLENLSNGYLVDILSSSVPAIFGLDTKYEYAEEPPQTLMKLIAARAGGDYVYLLDHAETMLKAAEDVLTTMLLFVVEDSILQATNDTFGGQSFSGQKTYTQQRLQVQSESLFIMLGSISVTALIVVAATFLRPRTTSSTNPETIAAMAMTLQNSSNIQRQLFQISSLNIKNAEMILKKHKYYTQILDGRNILFQTSGVERISDKRIIKAGAVRPYYNPWTLRIPFMLLTLLSPLLVIAILEVLQRLSDSSAPGIMPLKDDSSFVVRLLSRIIPALVMLLVSTLFNSFDFNSSMFAPFSKIRVKQASVDSLIRPLVGKMPPVALYNAFKNQYWSAFLTGSAAIVGSVLTIIVSGLYSIEYFPNSELCTINAVDSWNLSFHQGQSTDNATAAVSSLIEAGLLPYPGFTFDELVLPSLSLAESTIPVNTSIPGLVTAQIPALRAELSCTELSWSIFNFSVDYIPHYQDTELNIHGIVPLPDNCQRGSSNGNETYITFTNNPSSFDPVTNTSYVAEYVDLHVGLYDWLHGMDTDEYYLLQPDNPPGCPSVLLLYGFFDGSNKSRSKMTAQSCYQLVQKVKTNVTFTVPGISISQENPPEPDESTAKYVASGHNSTAFEWRVQSFLDDSFQNLNTSTVDPSAPDPVTSFFRGVLFGKTPLPLEALAAGSPGSVYTREAVFQHIQIFYRRYMAQYISANMRTSKNSSENTNVKKRDNSLIVDTGAVQGTFVPDIGIPRMVQNSTPKLILQVMLAFMFVCGVLAWLLGRFQGVLLFNPCSIVGVMVLLAGSKMCQPNDDDQQTGGESTDRVQLDTDDFEMESLTPSRNADASLDIDFNDQAVTQPDTSSQKPITREKNLDLSQGKDRLGWWSSIGCYSDLKTPPQVASDSANATDSTRVSLLGQGLSAEAGIDGGWRYGIDMI